jgi:hypothetical protein
MVIFHSYVNVYQRVFAPIGGEKQPPKQSSEADGRGALKHVGSPDDHPRWKFSVNIRDII